MRNTDGRGRFSSKLTSQEVQDMRAAYAGGSTMRSLAALYGVSTSCVWWHVEPRSPNEVRRLRAENAALAEEVQALRAALEAVS